jgi:hypothetical protein
MARIHGAIHGASGAQRALSKPLATSGLVRSFSWVLAGQVVTAAGQWAAIVILAKLGTLEALGQYAFANALVAPVFLMANAELRSVIVSDSHRGEALRDYVTFRVLTSSVAFRRSRGPRASP